MMTQQSVHKVAMTRELLDLMSEMSEMESTIQVSQTSNDLTAQLDRDRKERNAKRAKSQSPSNEKEAPVVWVLNNLNSIRVSWGSG